MCRNGLERPLAVEISKWQVFGFLSQLWSQANMENIVKFCITLHTMITEGGNIYEVLRAETIFNVDSKTGLPPNSPLASSRLLKYTGKLRTG